MEMYEVNRADLYPAFDPERQWLPRVYLAVDVDTRIAELERLLHEAASKGLCGKHFCGAPPGQDDLPCPYCIGLERTKG